MRTTLPSRPAHFSPAADGSGTAPAALLSTLLLGVILAVGPSVLGAVRPWVDLPILAGVALLIFLQGLRLAKSPPIGSLRQMDAIDFSVLLFVLYSVIRWRTSPTEFFSRFEILNVIGYASVFFFCRYGLARRLHGVALLMLLVILGAGETGFGYYLSLHSNARDPQSLWFPFGSTEQLQLYWAPRWLGSYGCPNHYASLLVMATGTAVALGCFSRFSWPLRIVFLYVAAVMMVGILYSGSRGAWFSLVGALGALIFFALRYGKLRWWWPLGGAVILALILAALVTTSNFAKYRVHDLTDILGSGSLNKYLRVELINNALRIARDHPIFGTGPATYEFLDPRYQSSTLTVRAVYTHNDYLNCVDDYGLVGFALAMFFVFAVTLALCSRLRSDSPWPDRTLVAAGLAAWCALLIHSFLDFNLHIPANALMLFALTGMALRRDSKEDATHHWSTLSLSRFGPALGWALAVFSLVYSAEIVRTALSDFPYERVLARVQFAPTEQSIHDLEPALAFDPGNVQALDLLADLHRVRASRADNAADRNAEAEASLQDYARALRGNPLDDTILARMGLSYDLLGRYTEAYFCFQTAVQHQPYNGQFWNALGTHFAQWGLLDKAEQAFQSAAQCPHGAGDAADSARRIHVLLTLEDTIPPPPELAPGAPETATDP